VATSAVREAGNGAAIVARVRREAGIDLEVISGKEEARLICLGVLAGTAKRSRALVIDIGGGSTEVIHAEGERPLELFSTAIGALRLTELFKAQRRLGPAQLELMREFAREVALESLPSGIPSAPRVALGSSGSIRAVVSFAGGEAYASAAQISEAVDRLVEMGLQGRRQRFEPRRADIIVAGAVTLEAVVKRLRLRGVSAVDTGLRDGILVEQVRKRKLGQDHVASDAAVALGRRFAFDERHGHQVARLATALFDDLQAVHRLPPAARTYLEVAAIVHDIGHAVSYQRHHRHTYYLVRNGDIPGLSENERHLVARIARFHRRGPPELNHTDMEGLTRGEAQLVRKLATLLRVADALDRSHHQPVRKIEGKPKGRLVRLRLHSREPVDLEIWDAEHEAPLFRRVFRKTLVFEPVKART
jgi:exopolyphosphatase/guanosine-5'-triphosphate,3'-diphosphate pyrophosphatase